MYLWQMCGVGAERQLMSIKTTKLNIFDGGTNSHIDFNEKLGIVVIVFAMKIFIITLSKITAMQIKCRIQPAPAAVAIASFAVRICLVLRYEPMAEMLCDMHERRSLNYRHHAKSYFITVNVWPCSYYPSVSIKIDERRRRRWRQYQQKQDHSLVIRIHLTALYGYLLWSIWLAQKSVHIFFLFLCWA